MDILKLFRRMSNKKLGEKKKIYIFVYKKKKRYQTIVFQKVCEPK